MILCCCRTYSTLIGQGKGSKTRLQQVVDWVGGREFDGCLIFDEVSPCARAAINAVATVAVAMVDLEQLLASGLLSFASLAR